MEVSDANKVWEQRVDPWMVLWPLLLMGLTCASIIAGIVGSAYVNDSYLSESSAIIDQLMFTSIGVDLAKVILAFMTLISLGLGGIVYIRIMNGMNETDSEICLTRRFIVITISFTIGIGLISYLYYSLPLVFSFGFYMTDIILTLISGIGLIIGLGYVIEFFSFTAETNAKGEKVAMYVVRSGTRPVATEVLTDSIGGFFYMLLDNRVKHAILKTISLTGTDMQSSPKSPEDIRREYRSPI